MGHPTKAEVGEIRKVAILSGDTDIIGLCDAYFALREENGRDRSVIMTIEQRKKLLDLTWTLCSIANHSPMPSQLARTGWQLGRMIELTQEIQQHLKRIQEGLIES